MRLRLHWLAIAGIFVLTLCQLARADEGLTLDAPRSFSAAPHISYLIDNSDKLTADAIVHGEYAWQRGSQAHLNLGYQEHPLWIKWRMQTRGDAPAPWYIIIHYPLLDEIEVFLRNVDQDRIESHWQGGDHLPFSRRELAHPKFIMPVTLTDHTTYEVIMRVNTSGAVQVPVTVESPEYFWQHERYLTIFEAGSYFISLAMALYNFVLFIFLRDRSYLFYVLYIVFFVVGFGSLRGWSGEFLFPETPALQNAGIIQGGLIAIACAGLFATSFMRLSQTSPRLHRVVTGQALLALFMALALLPVPYHWAIQITAGLTLLSSVNMVFVAVNVWWRTRSRQAALYCVSWLILLIGAGLNMSGKFGLLPVNFITEEGLRIGALFEIMFLSFALADRVNQDRTATEAAQRQIIEIQASMNSELEKQVKARTQELESLNIILHQNSITDPLTGVANRRHFDDVISREFKRAARDDLSLSVLMIDLDHFKKINDSHGHPMGDHCLKQAADTISTAIKRPPDIVARYGGEEFAVLLPNTPTTGAREVAQQILDSLRALDIVTFDGHRIPLTASIGIATALPRPGDEPTALMRAADAALYRAKHGGRNRVET